VSIEIQPVNFIDNKKDKELGKFSSFEKTHQKFAF